MANFLLIYTGGSMPESEEASQAVMKAWMDWFTTLGEAVVDSGNPIGPHAKTISKEGSIHDGFAGVPATGYSILKADTLDHATQMAKDCPHILSGGEVTVYETFNAM